ncbi:MAG TPA: flavin reductase family protein [Fimbriimonas sp.]
MHVDEETFRYALGHFASGVTVVTCAADGREHGTTVSAFCSVSLDPPLVLVCLDKRSIMCSLIESSKAFVVNILSNEQELVARHFASRVENRLSTVEYRLGTDGQPVLEGVLASIECRLESSCEGGDHTIFVGKVSQADVREGKPLLYFRGGYGAYSG